MLRRCRTCVMPDTRPDVPFVDGVCQACINSAVRPSIDWQARANALSKLLDRHDGRVIVPSSGGKDSSYIALRLRELGCDVTTVTATTCYLTPIGRANLDNLSRHVRTIEVTPNRSVRAMLCRKGLEMVGDPSWPQHASIWAIPFRMAVGTRTPLLMWGENSQDAYGGPPGSEQARQMTRRWCSEFGGLNGLRATDMADVCGLSAREISDYELPAQQELDDAGIEAHFLGAYEQWDSHRNAQVAIEHGMRAEMPCAANWWPFENLDCWVTSLHDALMYRKYGFGRGCVQISVDVRAGRITREKALAWVSEFDGILPEGYAGVSMERGLDWLGVSREHLNRVLDRYTDWKLFKGQGADRPLLREVA